MQSILEKICAQTFTRDALYHRLGIFETFLEEELFSQEASNAKLSRKEVFRATKKESVSGEDMEALSELDDSVWNFFSREKLAAQMAALKKEIESLPHVELYVPVTLDAKALASIGAWVRAQVHPQALLSLHIDPETVGGCSFVHNDLLHTISLKSKLQASRGLITSLLASYGPKS
jgi:F0F1-type ATP synthase delta subunit